MDIRISVPAVILLLALVAFPVSAQAPAGAAAAAPLGFRPSAGDDTLQQFAAELGRSPQERQELLQAITAAKAELFEKPYAARGWKNNVAGAYAFFADSVNTVWTGSAADAAAQDRLFARFGAELAPTLAGLPDRDKAVLYDTLIASASLPLLLYIDGKQRGNPAQIEQARTLAAEYSRRILHSEPQEVAAMLRPGASAGASAGVGAAASTGAAPGAAGGALEGEYTCSQLQMLNMADASGSLQIRWVPNTLPPFRIGGGRYTAAGGGGSVAVDNGVIGFHGGAYDGWRGAIGNDARSYIVFNGADHGVAKSAKPGRGDYKCSARSG